MQKMPKMTPKIAQNRCFCVIFIRGETGGEERRECYPSTEIPDTIRTVEHWVMCSSDMDNQHTLYVLHF